VALASEYSHLLPAMALLGLGGGAVNGAGNTLVAELHDDPRAKSAALNLLGVFFGFGALLLPFSIGLLLARLGLAGILFAAAGLSLIVAGYDAAVPYPPPRQADRLPLREAVRLLSDPLLLLFAATLFFESGNEFIAGGYVSTFLVREIGLSVRGASWVISGYWAALMLARAVLSRLARLLPGTRIVAVCALWGAVAVAVLVSARAPVTAVAATLAIGAALAGIFPTALGIVGARYESLTGTVFGLVFTAALCGGVTLPWVTGVVAQARGLRVALALVVVQFLAVAALQAIAARSLRAAPER
jgi:MFS transporter, FHS family, glucose/mannose:H+ symporter